MLNIAIVEDNKSDRLQLLNCLKTYENNKSDNLYSIKNYDDPLDFLDNCKIKIDLLFLDINMPYMTGMQLAKKLRENNQSMIIIFVTNMLQYAIEGYKVKAFDFLLKPIEENVFFRTMDRIIEMFNNSKTQNIIIKNNKCEGKIVLSVKDIFYIESSGHKVIYHTKQGDYEEWDTLNKVQKNLPKTMFSRSHVSFIVNLNYVSKVEKDEIYINSVVLPISRTAKKNFFAELAKFLGENIQDV